MTASPSSARTAIESLRSGVPSAAMVSVLGSQQIEIEERFLKLIDRIGDQEAAGLLIGGGFGAGKSHMLQYLGLLARDLGFVISHVVVSKEIQLSTPAKVIAAALANAVLPSQQGPAIENIAGTIDVEGSQYAELMRWCASPSSGLDERFAASLLLYAKMRGHHDEFSHALVRFWSGEALSTADLRRRLREFNEQASFGRVPPVELARQRLRFAARLMSAAGYGGWIIFFDEAELIGRYALVSRAKAYAEVDRMLTGDHGGAGVAVGAVVALTDDFPAAVFDGKRDREMLPARVRARETGTSAELARRAEAAMGVIEREMQLLVPPEDADLDEIYQKLKELHGVAYDWSPPDVVGLPRSGASRMRQYIRAWINEWDLTRLDPGFSPQTFADELPSRQFGVPAEAVSV